MTLGQFLILAGSNLITLSLASGFFAKKGYMLGVSDMILLEMKSMQGRSSEVLNNEQAFAKAVEKYKTMSKDSAGK